MAKDLLRQVVARYLARETATIQVLQSIKTLAMEMSYAMVEGDWKHLVELLDRHWQLNQVLDPNTANAPINAILDRARPYISGAKLREPVMAASLCCWPAIQKHQRLYAPHFRSTLQSRVLSYLTALPRKGFAFAVVARN